MSVAIEPIKQKASVLPPGWQLLRLEQITNCLPGAWGEDQSFEGCIPVTVVGTSHISNEGSLNANDAPTRFLRPTEQDAIAFEGDLLVVKSSGSAANIRSGKTAICPADLSGKIAAANFLMRLVPNRSLVDPYLLWLYLNSGSAKAFVRKIAGSSTYPNIKWIAFKNFTIPLPPLAEQRRIAAILNEQMEAIERARQAAEAQLDAAYFFPFACIRDSLQANGAVSVRMADCLTEVSSGVGDDWRRFPVLVATRNGLAPAKEPVGKRPERYKLVNRGTVFYNPMRILIGSIAMVDDDDAIGITSPDYVVVRANPGRVHPRWFYFWLRSNAGEDFIKSLARGAVRERMLFRRLASGVAILPPYEAQCAISERMKDIRPITRAIQNRIDTIDKLPAALLREAFSGRL